MKRTASAVWHGSLKEGKGELTTDSGILSSTRYSFGTRFEDEKGTNPEELIGAAHAGCFSMALSKILGDRDATPKRVDTKATVHLEKGDEGMSITRIHLDTRVEAPGLDPEKFEKAANDAKSGCIVSQVLKAEITMDATLVN